jgi:hypothetical protein
VQPRPQPQHALGLTNGFAVYIVYHSPLESSLAKGCGITVISRRPLRDSALLETSPDSTAVSRVLSFSASSHWLETSPYLALTLAPKPIPKVLLLHNPILINSTARTFGCTASPLGLFRKLLSRKFEIFTREYLCHAQALFEASLRLYPRRLSDCRWQT